MKEHLTVGIVCYPTPGGSGVVATELGKSLAECGHDVHFVTSGHPSRLREFHERVERRSRLIRDVDSRGCLSAT